MNVESNPPSIRGSKSVLYPDQITFREKNSGFQKCLLILVLLLTAAAAVFLSLFLVYYFKYEDKVDDEVCNTPSCITTANSLLVNMDSTVDPCVDFAEYACGTFYKNTYFKEGRTTVTSFSKVGDANEELIKAILMEEETPGGFAYMRNMKNLYMSCMDEAKIEEVGLQPFLDTPQAKEWPTLIGADWPGEATFDLNDVIARYEEVYVEPIFVYYITADQKNSSRNKLYLTNPSVGLSREYMIKPRNDTVIMAYQRLLTDIAIELGAEPTVAAQDAADRIDFFRELAKIVVPREQQRDATKLYNPTTVGELGRNYTFIDIPRALRTAFANANITLEDDLPVNNNFPSFFEQLEGVLAKTSNRTLQNLFGFSFALQSIGGLTKKLRQISFEFDKVYSGTTEEKPRWKTCVNSAIYTFDLAMGKEYTRRQFSEASKDYMNVMIDNLKDSFREQLHQATWMNEKTKTTALEKLTRMKRKIGYPEVKFDNEYIEDKYKEYHTEIDNYYKNKLTYGKVLNIEVLKSLQKPVDKTKWGLATFEVNAYYSSVENEIVFPAGVLRPPFFSDQFTDAINYGAIGVVIGHEITHGFDDRGKQFDQFGNLRNWWHPEDIINFMQRARCLVEQYGNFTDKIAGLNVNGINTQGENIADNGGLKESYFAYKKLMERKGKPKALPGLGLTDSQLFFLGYSQMWCMKSTRESAIQQVKNGAHSPGRFRIIGPLQNSHAFAEAFNCPKGSQMNPEKKCSVW